MRLQFVPQEFEHAVGMRLPVAIRVVEGEDRQLSVDANRLRVSVVKINSPTKTSLACSAIARGDCIGPHHGNSVGLSELELFVVFSLITRHPTPVGQWRLALLP